MTPPGESDGFCLIASVFMSNYQIINCDRRGIQQIKIDEEQEE